MFRRCSISIALAAALVASAGQARANPELLLQQAERFYEQLEYPRALKVLIAVLQAKGVTPIQKARAYLYMGVCFTALGKPQNAVSAFMEVLKLRPRFRLPNGVSPSIRTVFAEALKRLKMPAIPPPPKKKKKKPQGPVNVDIDASGPRKAVAGRPIEIKISIEDPRKKVRSLVIRWRRIGGPDFSSIKIKHKPGQTSVTGLIPGATVGRKKGRLTYYVQAVDEVGNVMAKAASEDEPHEVELLPAPKKGSSWGWWVLGATGAAAAIAGGIVAVIFLTRSNGVERPPNTADVTIAIE